MSLRMRDLLMGELGSLRHEPTEKRIRATLGGRTVVDSTRALLVWEPKRVVPSYAVPIADVDGELAAGDGVEAEPADVPRLGDRPVLDPSVPFAVHTTGGEPLELRAPGGAGVAAAFRPADPELRDHVVLDFGSFDAWFEEDEPNMGHPRDPFHRIDIVHSSRRVQVALDGTTLADSSRPALPFEPPIPARYYLPREDVRMDLLRPSDTHTTCAYKGVASYFSAGDQDDVAWTFPEPQREAAEVTGLIAFFNERVDITVDGEALERPVTPWSRRS